MKPEVSKYNRSILRIFPYGAEVSFTDFPLVTVRVGGDRRVIIASMFTLAKRQYETKEVSFLPLQKIEMSFYYKNLQSNQVKRTPQESVNEFIIQKLNPLLVADFRLIPAFLHA